MCLSKGEETSPRDSQRAEGLCICPISEQLFRTGQPNGRLGRRSSPGILQDPVVQTQAASIYRETAACEDSAVASSHSPEHSKKNTVRAQLEGGSRPAYHRRQNGHAHHQECYPAKGALGSAKNGGVFFCAFVYYYYYYF